MRLFFATDVHGSDICFKKFVNSGKFYKADVIILGGDTTGKMLVFLVDQGDGSFLSNYSSDEDELFHEGAELEEHEKNIRNSGYYPYRVTKAQMRELNSSHEAMESLFQRVMLETTERWVKLAEERLKDTSIRCIIAPGNDDHLEIDEVIKASERIEYGEGRVIDLGKHELLSCGWTNPTPWDTPRECSEEELLAKIEGLAKEVKNPKSAIFNLHAPPYRSGLDDAPELKENLQMVAGGATKPVGSTAVRAVIEKYQPMLGLHGHIHEGKGEQKIGKTMCINPGSAYGDWVLQGYLADVDDRGIGSQLLITG
ncbi:MAG: metallophosphoesterase [Chloroflexi bacterium]|nr:metallophosphoesterase [Chloroflexota bacterium]